MRLRSVDHKVVGSNPILSIHLVPMVCRDVGSDSRANIRQRKQGDQ